MFLEFKQKIKSFFDFFLNLIYTQKCLVCSCAKTENFLCKNCLKNVQFLSSFPHRIYIKIPIYSATIYDDVIKKLIHSLKFKHKKTASIPIANILFSYYKKLDIKNNDFIIVYPPSFYLKALNRGYNHMKLITNNFAKLSNLKIEHNLIKKIKYTKPQFLAKNRHKNIQGSFNINKSLIEKYKNKNILLIDDITTSGATLEEIINCLLKENINNIICLTVSKTK